MDWHLEYTWHASEGLNLESIADELMSAFSSWSPAVSLDDKSITVALTVEAPSLKEALEDGFERLSSFSGREIEPIAARVSRQADFEAALLEPRIPQLMGVAEIAERLGVSKQRVSELARGQNFPRPVIALAAGPVWLASSIEGFVASWPRKAGRTALRAAL